MAGEKYTNIGKARWENANVGVIKWDPENKAGLASVIDETTGTVYEIGGGGGGENEYSTAEVTFSGMWPQTTIFIGLVENRGISAILPMGKQTLVLYNGSQVVPNIVTDGTVTATGDIEVSQAEGADYPTVTISGDGTLSISADPNT